MATQREIRFINSKFWKSVKKTPLYDLYRKTIQGQLEKKRRKTQAEGLQKFGYQMLNEIFVETNHHDIKVFAIYGTLLGFIRDKDFIKFDFDMDLGIFVDTQETFRQLENVLLPLGYRKVREFELHNLITEQTYNKNGLEVDFFGIFPYENKYITYGFYQDTNVHYDSADLFNVRYHIMEIEHAVETINIHGVDITIPRDYEYMLKLFYGENWRIPDPNFESIAKVMDKSVMGKEIRYD